MTAAQGAGLAMLMGLVAALFVSLILVMGPGAALFSLVADNSGRQFDTGQMWAFGAAISGMILSMLCLLYRDVRDGARTYLLLSVAITASYAFSHFGLKADFPLRHWVYYFPPEHGAGSRSPEPAVAATASVEAESFDPTILRLNCANGWAASCDTLGEIYDRGSRVKRDQEVASAYYQRACEIRGEARCSKRPR